MTKSPEVSVIVPLYKVEQYVKFCVDSILAQTFQDFEIILVDDASPDGCVELCQKLYGDNPKVKLVRHEKNLGLGAARNTGMKHALGKYVCFVDSDDFILPDALEKFYAAAEKNNAEVVHAAAWYELNQNEPFPIVQQNLRPRLDGYSQEGFLQKNFIQRTIEHLPFARTAPMTWLYFCRRDFLEKNKIKFLPIISEDEPFHFAMLLYAERYYVLRQAVYIYRKRNDSIMEAKSPDKLGKALDGTFAALAYVRKLLKRVEPFDGYDQWRDNILNMFSLKCFQAHSNFYYTDSNVNPEVNAVVQKTFAQHFGNNESFVRFFFNGFHVLNRQVETLSRQNQAVLNQSQRINTLSAFFVREQPNMLRIMDLLRANSKRIFVMGTPSHGNLGDQAIVAGELFILKNYFPDHTIIDIPYNYLTGELGELFWGLGFNKFVRDTGTIFMHGGGNLGNLWVNEENLRRKLIEKFPENKIVIFPQSIYFSDDDAGRRELATSQQIYNAHKDLHLMTRDENSFGIAQKIFPQVHNYLMPDAATALHGILDDVDVKREGVLFVLRSDKEKVRNDGNIEMLQAAFSRLNIPFKVTDTVIGENVSTLSREPKIRDVLMKIRKSKLVVTDRFHGVIFSFITRTPVLAFKSFDTKISSGIKWFKDLPSIFYAEDKNSADVEAFINRALSDNVSFPEMNPETKFNIPERFIEVLNRIVGHPLIHTTPPRLPQIVDKRTDSQEKHVTEDLFRQLLTNPIFKSNIDLLTKIYIQEKDTQNIMQTLELVGDKYHYELVDEKPWRPKILEVADGIDELLASGKSLCRLGDGECKLMMGIGLDFQQPDRALAKKLLQILEDEPTNCYVALPRYYWYLQDDIEHISRSRRSKQFYTFQVPPIRKFFADHCNKNKTYVDACLVSYTTNKSTEACEERFRKLKSLFNGRKVLIVAGETVFKNITYDFFDGVAQKEFLFAPRVNAWYHYDEILNKILTYPKDFVIALILGPTATVLAYELSKLGYVAYDTGHVPKDYDAFMKGADRSDKAIQKFYAAD